jgi:CMP-N,N'-diacetyllegionaminic acid synthase
MKVLGIIPARAGSKRLPGKNVAELGGKPLWRHAVDHAKESGMIEPVVLTTNDPAVLATAQDVWTINRPDDLAQDDTEMFPVVQHAHERIKLLTGGIFDAVCVLQPTSPFRTAADIANCVALMQDTGAESVVSVFDGPDDLAFKVRHAGRLERLPTIVIPNGAIYLLRVDKLERGEDWYGDHAYGYVMPRDRSLDINVAFDLAVAQFMYGKTS